VQQLPKTPAEHVPVKPHTQVATKPVCAPNLYFALRRKHLQAGRAEDLTHAWHRRSPNADAGRSVLLCSAVIISASRSCIEILRLLSSVVSCSTADRDSFNLLRRLRVCGHTQEEQKVAQAQNCSVVPLRRAATASSCAVASCATAHERQQGRAGSVAASHPVTWQGAEPSEV
jgi:hypothetical protein